MDQSVTREDIEDILQAFEQSAFAHLELTAGSVRIAVNRYPARPAHSGDLLLHTAPVAAPLLGTYQAGPEAGSPAFVRPGAAVEPDTTVAIIRVLQNLTPVKAGLSGTVLQILVQDGQLVEFGQPLMQVRTEPAPGDDHHLESS